MSVRLSVYAAAGPVSVHRLAPGRAYVIGREESCDVQVVDDRVSRRHARLASHPDGGWLLTDLGSKNGLLLAGERVEECQLTEPAWLALGGVPAHFEPLDEAWVEADESDELSRRRVGARLQRDLDPALGLAPLLDRVLDSVMSMAGAERGFLILTRADGDHRLVRVAGLAAEDLARGEFEGSIGVVERAIRERRPVVCCDSRNDASLGDRPSVLSGGIRSLICLPLMVLDRLLGVVYADSREPVRNLTELDVEILEGLVGHAALGLAVNGLNLEVQGLGDRLGERLAGGPATPSDATVAAQAPNQAESWRRLTAVHRLPGAEDPE